MMTMSTASPTMAPVPCDHCAKDVPANVVRRCADCMAGYCTEECQLAAWSCGHKEPCQAIQRADILDYTGHESLWVAASRGDMAAVRALAEAGADVDEEVWNFGTVIDGTTPIMAASGGGRTPVVRYLARLGCSLSRKTLGHGHTALDLARGNGHPDTARLLSDIDAAGGWRPYAAAFRMAYVRIRHEVSATYAVLDEGHDDRELLHFVFGRNSDETKAMLELPDVVFRLVCRFLVE